MTRKIKCELESLFSSKKEGGDNTNCPRYVALCQEDYIESDDCLDELVYLIEETNHEGDVVIWDGDQVAVVIRDGVVQIRLETSPPPPYRLKKPWNKVVNHKWNHKSSRNGKGK